MHGAIATADMQPVPARPFFHKIIQIPCFLKCVCMFLQRFPSKHGNLHICRQKTVPKLIFTMFPSPLSPQTLENAAIYTVFFNFSICQCRWPTQTYIQKSFKKHCFFHSFYIFSVKNIVIYTFFGLKSVQNTGFCSVFNALASKNHSRYRYLQCFFISVRFSPCRKPTKMTQNSVSMAS